MGAPGTSSPGSKARPINGCAPTTSKVFAVTNAPSKRSGASAQRTLTVPS